MLLHQQQEDYFLVEILPSYSDVIDYIIDSAGDATDFGNLTVARQAI